MRYNSDFDAKVITYYKQGHTSNVTVKIFYLDKPFVLKWVKQYQSIGIEAIRLKTTKVPYSSDFKPNLLTIQFE